MIRVLISPLTSVMFWMLAAFAHIDAAEPIQVVNLWPQNPPDFKPTDEPERDTSGPDSNQVAGQSVIRLGHVQTPQAYVYLPQEVPPTSTAVIVAPGGGYSILAWDLEGTEIAEWLNSVGVTAIVLKYRVPTRNETPPWFAPVQDIQRCIELLRAGYVAGLKPNRIGVLGFSAGGNASARAATAPTVYYSSNGERFESVRNTSNATKPTFAFRPDFAILVYPAWLVREDDPSQLIDGIQVDETTPPMFFAHAQNDRVSCRSSITLFTELQKRASPSALHIFADGGHGFGKRPVGLSHDLWPRLCEQWLRDRGWLNP